jgi:hypothetical protein
MSLTLTNQLNPNIFEEIFMYFVKVKNLLLFLRQPAFYPSYTRPYWTSPLPFIQFLQYLFNIIISSTSSFCKKLFPLGFTTETL